MRAFTPFAAVLFACAACVTSAHASDWTGAYARIDKVVLEPNAETPETVQIWGVFSVTDPKEPGGYQPVARGYMYFKLDHNPESNRLGRDPEQAVTEWNDLKRLAGTGQIVTFGSRTATPPRVRKADEKPDSHDFYVMNSSPVRVRSDTDYPPIKAIADFKD